MTPPLRMAKSSRLGAKGSFVIRERKVKSFDCVSSQALRLLCYFGGAITVELCSMVKCALWGLRGRTPYKVMQGSVCILAFFHVLRALATTEKTLRHAAGAQARAYLHEEACTVARHPHPYLAVRLNVFRDF